MRHVDTPYFFKATTLAIEIALTAIIIIAFLYHQVKHIRKSILNEFLSIDVGSERLQTYVAILKIKKEPFFRFLGILISMIRVSVKLFQPYDSCI